MKKLMSLIRKMRRIGKAELKKVTSYKLQVTSYKSQVTSYKLQDKTCRSDKADKAAIRQKHSK